MLGLSSRVERSEGGHYVWWRDDTGNVGSVIFEPHMRIARRRRNRTPACLHAPWVEATSEHQPDSPPHAVRLQIFNRSCVFTNAPMIIDSHETTLTILHVVHDQDHFLIL